jgi:hypothetical protein
MVVRMRWDKPICANYSAGSCWKMYSLEGLNYDLLISVISIH